MRFTRGFTQAGAQVDVAIKNWWAQRQANFGAVFSQRQGTPAVQIAASDVIDAFVDQCRWNRGAPCFTGLQTARIIGQQQPAGSSNRRRGDRLAALDQWFAVECSDQQSPSCQQGNQQHARQRSQETGHRLDA